MSLCYDQTWQREMKRGGGVWKKEREILKMKQAEVPVAKLPFGHQSAEGHNELVGEIQVLQYWT